jgi:type IX secretion system PorP/SprF family membrane protein
MNKLGGILIVLFLLLNGFVLRVSAQQMPTYSQYRMNEFLFNPAIAGSDGYTAVNLIAREQWLGIPSSPKTHAIAFQTRFLPSSFIFRGNSVRKHRSSTSRDSRVGLGAFIYNDRTGLLDRTGAQFSYAYHIPMSRSQLSFGLSLNFYQFKFDHSPDKIVLADNDLDQTLQNSYKNMYIPDLNFGVYLYSGRYYAGLSITDLTQAGLIISKNEKSDYQTVRNYLLIGGYRYRLNYNLVLEPNTLIKVSEKGVFQADFGVKAHINEDYWAGFSFRTKNTIILLGGVRVDKFYFGYAFDFSFSQLQHYTFGTHEITAALRFGENARRYRWLNKF